jgi:hypothetical protein
MINEHEHREESFAVNDDNETGEHTKTVYAHFGAAIYFGQCLEHGLVNALIYLDLIPNYSRPVHSAQEWAPSVDGFMEKHFEQTLGRLIARLRVLAPMPEELSDILSVALKKRNWLAHDYFRERADGFFTRTGRDRMIGELEEAQELFRHADRMLDIAFKPIREKDGFTDERLKQAYEQLLLEVRRNEND